MKYGLNSVAPAGTWSAIRGETGPFAGYRCYATPAQGVPVAWPVAPAGASFTILSIKPDIPTLLTGSLDSQLRSLVAGAAPGDWLTCWHEGETNDGWTPAQIKACHAHVWTVVHKARPDVLYGQIVSAYTASKASAYYPLSQWVAKRSNGSHLDFYGIDGYHAQAVQTISYVFDAAAGQIRMVVPKGPLAVTETNSVQPGRAAWLAAAYAWAVENGCLAFFPWFGLTEYAWDPSDTATIVEMRRELGVPAAQTISAGEASRY